MTTSNRLRTRYDVGTNQVLLQINDVRPQDVGQYLVVATNPAGKDSTGGSLSVVPEKPGPDDRGFAPEDKFRTLEQPRRPTRRPLQIVPGVDIQPLAGTEEGDIVTEEQRPPRVIVPLSDGVVEETMPVLLTTKVDAGAPFSTVSVDVFYQRIATKLFTEIQSSDLCLGSKENFSIFGASFFA